MDRKEALKIVNVHGARIWRDLGKMYPALRVRAVPEIKLNARLTRTAGRAFQADGYIDLGWKFILHSNAYARIMQDVILPHEIAHMADYYLFGESEKRCGHGKNWARIMVQLGLPPEKYHTLEIIK